NVLLALVDNRDFYIKARGFPSFLSDIYSRSIEQSFELFCRFRRFQFNNYLTHPFTHSKRIAYVAIKAILSVSGSNIIAFHLWLNSLHSRQKLALSLKAGSIPLNRTIES